MGQKKKEDLIEVLMEHEQVPETTVTFGKLISQALKAKEAQIELTAKEKSHNRKYERWQSRAERARRYPVGHPIYSQILYWEMRVCRFPDEAIQWFSQLDAITRIDLCIMTRECRKRGI